MGSGLDAQVNVGLHYDGTSYRMLGNKSGGVGGTTISPSFTLNTWHTVEIYHLNRGGAADGTIQFFLDGVAQTALNAFDAQTITSGIVGVRHRAPTTTGGYILFDDIIADDAQLFTNTPDDRFPTSQLLTQSGHVLVGPGRIDNITLLAGAATDNVLSIFDTDTASTSDASRSRGEIRNTSNSESVDLPGVPIHVNRGCYIALSGTNPRAIVTIGYAPAYGSDGAVRTYGIKRLPTPGNI